MSRAMHRAKSPSVFVLHEGDSVGSRSRDGMGRVIIGSLDGLLLGNFVAGDTEGVPLGSIVSGDIVGSAGNDAFSSITWSVTSVSSAAVGMVVGLGLGLSVGGRLDAMDGEEDGSSSDVQGCDLRPKRIFDSGMGAGVGERDGSNVDTASFTATSPSTLTYVENDVECDDAKSPALISSPFHLRFLGMELG